MFANQLAYTIEWRLEEVSQEIYITENDKLKLLDFIDKNDIREVRTANNLKALKAEISKAIVIDPEVFAGAFVKINSKVNMLVDQEEEEIILVYPEDADIKSNKVSVLSPIGTAILGCSEGSCIEWIVPNGSVHIHIQSIID